MNSEVIEIDEQVVAIGTNLEGWLAQRWTEAELLDWLQGYALPAVGYDDEPFLWIVRALEISNNRFKAETELSLRLAEFLRTQPDTRNVGDRPSEVLYNLLMLCASLSYPEHLNEALINLFTRRTLQGEWLGIDLRIPLLSALISNQIDERLLPVWQSIIETGSHEYLPATMDDAVQGLALMPKSEAEPDDPPLEEIGEALSRIAVKTTNCSDRRTRFHQYVQCIVNASPRPQWDAELIWLCHEKNLPDWAVVSLPNLFVPADPDHLNTSSYLVWAVLPPFLQSFGVEYSIENRICDGKILVLQITGLAAEFAEGFVSAIDQRRFEPGLQSYSAVLGSITDWISELIVAENTGASHTAWPCFNERIGPHAIPRMNTSMRKKDALEHAHQELLKLNNLALA